jgi:hypothetical protein
MKKRNLIIILTVIIGVILLLVLSYFFVFKNITIKTNKTDNGSIKKTPVNIEVGNSENADVYIDGKLIGKGKIKIDLPEGVHIIKAIDPEKGEFNEPLLVNTDNGDIKKIINLTPNRRAFTIDTGVDNSTIYVDNEKLMTFNKSFTIMVPFGKHTIKITSPGYKDFVKEVFINEKFSENFSVKLTK